VSSRTDPLAKRWSGQIPLTRMRHSLAHGETSPHQMKNIWITLLLQFFH
jgi:hypothetical protein